ncbi:MAG: ATP-dependent Clp protease ATP-binding subunit [Lachnospiraceae bacterium]|nr:ATP-dependent Clp protease ATP-binding subunit [Lachnospiraceae bacterium]
MEYTEKTAQVLKIAEECAEELNQNYVGTEHILTGLLKEGNGVAAFVLSENNIKESQILELIQQLVAPGSDIILQEKMGYTPRAKKILSMSEETARRFHADLIGTEHILLSLIREGESVAIRLMNTLGVNLPKLYADTLSAMGEDPSLTKEDLRHRKGDYEKSSTPMLDQYSRDLTALAKEGRLDPVVGRNKEIMRVIQILSRRTKNNPCLVGEPGVGKTAIAEGLAVRIVNGNVPSTIENCRLVSLDMSGMVAGSKYRGEFEERIKRVMREVIDSGNILLFMDEIHTLIGAGGAEGAIDASSMLKPSLARGELQMIGATTLDEYRKYIERDAALERRFQPVTVEEPSEEEAIEILNGIKDKYEEHHGVTIPEDAVKAAVHLTSRYINDRFLPDKAIDVMDEAASRLKLLSLSPSNDEASFFAALHEAEEKMERAIGEGDFEMAASLRKDYLRIKKKLSKAEDKRDKRIKKEGLVLTEDDIANVVSVWTKIPLSRLTEKENQKLLKLEEKLKSRVIGQDEAVHKVAQAIKRGRVGLKDPKRPIGSFLFLGPTGVGKTELSKALANILFGSDDAMIRVDMSEFMEPHSVAKMIGSPPGYVGHDEGGQLAEKIRRNPYSVVLFDEIEKAHPDVFNVLLQVLDEGHITDSKGRKVSFKNAVIIMTSNAGAAQIVDPKRLGFNASDTASDRYNSMKKNVMDEVKRIFRPEFINRIDDIIVFHALGKEELRGIIELLAKELSKRAKEQMEIKLHISPQVRDKLIEKGSDNKFGARPLRRTLQEMVEDPLAEEVLKGNCKNGDTVKVSLKKGEIFFKTGR